MHTHLPWHAPLILCLGTWLIYIADRILDGSHSSTLTPLRERHYFHARHRTAFLSAAAIVGSVLVWLILMRMMPQARYEDTILFLGALCYLFLVHSPASNQNPWLPKELAVGIVFAGATAIPAWSRIDGRRMTLLPAIAIFAALCWLNCVAIERWENDLPITASSLAGSHPSTRWASNNFRVVAWSLAVAAASLVLLKPGNPVYLAALMAAACLATVDGFREELSPLALRIAADASLLTPLLVLPFVR
ncbi:hypothetical protein ACPOL_5104 [Acidisarcina polymorpha]|uniref:Uncharacterized protein n=2 Tax=Acidisarcina polymorpha TaxID=2211140 RepID=A0A2Z5G5U9_9BACT|nr:hypothetical protein ACPOL_5104 [Acidisarcina polymorpha]